MCCFIWNKHFPLRLAKHIRKYQCEKKISLFLLTCTLNLLVTLVINHWSKYCSTKGRFPWTYICERMCNCTSAYSCKYTYVCARKHCYDILWTPFTFYVIVFKNNIEKKKNRNGSMLIKNIGLLLLPEMFNFNECKTFKRKEIKWFSKLMFPFNIWSLFQYPSSQSSWKRIKKVEIHELVLLPHSRLSFSRICSLTDISWLEEFTIPIFVGCCCSLK